MSILGNLGEGGVSRQATVAAVVQAAQAAEMSGCNGYTAEDYAAVTEGLRVRADKIDEKEVYKKTVIALLKDHKIFINPGDERVERLAVNALALSKKRWPFTGYEAHEVVDSFQKELRAEKKVNPVNLINLKFSSAEDLHNEL
jgi:hypothetical protein